LKGPQSRCHDRAFAERISIPVIASGGLLPPSKDVKALLEPRAQSSPVRSPAARPSMTAGSIPAAALALIRNAARAAA